MDESALGLGKLLASTRDDVIFSLSVPAHHRERLSLVEVAEHDTTLIPSFALVEPGEDVKPDTARLLGMVCEPGQRACGVFCEVGPRYRRGV